MRQAVQDLGADAVSGRKLRTVAMPRAMIRNCRKSLFRWKVADSTGTELNGGKLLIGTFIVRRLLLRHVLVPHEKYVGILLPPSVGSVIANVALSMTGRVAANLNYTATSDVLNTSMRHAGIRRILTSRKFTDQLRAKQLLDASKLDAELVYLRRLRRPRCSAATSSRRARRLCRARDAARSPAGPPQAARRR